MKAKEKIYEDVKVCCQIVDYKVDRDYMNPVKMNSVIFDSDDNAPPNTFSGTFDEILESFTEWAEYMFESRNYWNAELPDAELRDVDYEEGCLYYVVPKEGEWVYDETQEAMIKEDDYEECWYSQIYICIEESADALIEKGEELFYSDEPEDEYPDAEKRKAIAAFLKHTKDAWHAVITDDDIDWLYAGEFVPYLELEIEIRDIIHDGYGLFDGDDTVKVLCNIPYINNFTFDELEDIAQDFVSEAPSWEYVGLTCVARRYYYNRVLYTGYPKDRAGFEVMRKEVSLKDGLWVNQWRTEDMTDETHDAIMRYGYGVPFWTVELD